MRKKWTLRVVGGVCLMVAVAFLLACAGPAPTPAPAPAPAPAPTPAPAPKPAPAPAPAPAGQVFEFKMDTSDGTYVTYPYPRFQKRLEEASGGRIKIKTTYDMLPMTEVVYGVIDGRIDIGYQRVSYVAQTFPILDMAAFPFLWENSHEYESFINDPVVNDAYNKAFTELGLVKLFFQPSGTQDCVFSKRSIAKVDDFKNLKIRSLGGMNTEVLQLLGASPLMMPGPETVDALNRGTIDAVFTGRGYGLEVGLTDVAKYVAFWPFQSEFAQFFAMNKKKFDAMPADLQKIMLDVSKEMQGQCFTGANEYRFYTPIGLRASGISIVQPERAEWDKARKIVEPAVTKWLKTAGAQGQQLLDIANKYAGKSGVKF